MFLGVENVMVSSGLQYFSSTLDALHWSSVALEPQPLLTPTEMLCSTLLNTSLCEQTQDCSCLSPELHDAVRVPMLRETALEAHKASMLNMSRSVTSTTY